MRVMHLTIDTDKSIQWVMYLDESSIKVIEMESCKLVYEVTRKVLIIETSDPITMF